MPYATNADLPEEVRRRYSARCQAAFREAFNGAEGDESERFKVAHTVAGRCQSATGTVVGGGLADRPHYPPAGKSFLPLKAGPLEDPGEVEAWFAGRIARRLLVVPFGGPIPSKAAPLGVDLDGEWFSERTDIHGPYDVLRRVRDRLVDWHHRGDPTGVMQSAIIGKAVLDEEPDEDGWWADFWFKAGEKRVALIRRLAERGAQLFGSSEPTSKADVTKDRATGEILRWPVLFETLSTSPQNTLSVIRPAKARIDEALDAGQSIDEALRSLASELDALGRDLREPSETGADAAKAGRDLGVDDDALAAVARLDATVLATEDLARRLTRRA